MKNSFLILSIVLLSNLVNAQSFKKENKVHRKDQNDKFKDPKESPLTKEDRSTFKALEYFPLAEKYRVIAKFTVNLNPQLFKMPTSTDRLPEYSTYGELSFEINGQPYSLQVYQNQGLINEEGYEDYLFIPFADETNAVETYGGGRYLDFRMPTTEEVFIDFNMAYNPYCAYNDRYSCPKVPEVNILPVRIEAGVLNMKH
jgi:hypothetical protein